MLLVEMNNTLACFCCILFCFLGLIGLIIIFVCSWQKYNDRTCDVECLGTGEVFKVQNNKNEPEWVRQEVALRISNLAKKMDKVVNYMKENNLPDPLVANRLYKRWKNVRTTPGGLRETSFGESSAAYTVNKGDQMRICIRDEKSDNLFEDPNDAFFVLLHEVAHLASKSFGHNLEFKQNFSYVTKIAVQLGLYKYQDYTKKAVTYCGVDITYPSY
jgi:hypothetical protein